MTNEQLKKLYAIGNEKTKAYLEQTNPGFDFSEPDMTAFYEACEKTGKPKTLDLSSFPEDLRESTWWDYVVKVCTEAINDGERIDLFDKDKPRQYPWFDTKGSPARFRFYGVVYAATIAHAGSGSRLSFVSEEKTKEAGESLKEYYEKMLSA